MDKDIRLIITIKNNRLLKEREALGLSQAKMAAFCDIDINLYGLLERLQKKPIGQNKKWSKGALKIAKALNKPVGNIFPDFIKHVKVNKVEKEIDFKDMSNHISWGERAALPCDEIYDGVELSKNIDECLAKLTPTEERIVRLRFGLTEEGETESLLKIGKKFGVTEEAIRQREKQAIKKLKRFKELKEDK